MGSTLGIEDWKEVIELTKSQRKNLDINKGGEDVSYASEENASHERQAAREKRNGDVMAKKDKVEVQKGPIKSGEPTYRTQKWNEKYAQAKQEKQMLRSAQTCTTHIPKQ